MKVILRVWRHQRGTQGAIIGSGISGLGAAHALSGRADITLLEAGNYFGGHTNTVDVTLPDAQGNPFTHGVDTGFLVFNERTYPKLIALLDKLGVRTAQSDMSFSVQARQAGQATPLAWSGTDLNGLFAQRSNLWSPRFWGMLKDLMRFNALTTRLAECGTDAQMQQTLGTFLDEQRFGQTFGECYFMPMMACIWSCPTQQMLQFPVATMVRFCHNHGLLQVTNRPQWWTVQGGARHYVQAITAHIADKRLNSPVQGVSYDAQANARRGGVWVRTAQGQERALLGPSTTSPMWWYCTQTPPSCRPGALRGPPGTTNARKTHSRNRPVCVCPGRMT